MYYEYFGLSEAPFKITPNPVLFYTGGNRGAILDALVYAVVSGEGIIKVLEPDTPLGELVITFIQRLLRLLQQGAEFEDGFSTHDHRYWADHVVLLSVRCFDECG